GAEIDAEVLARARALPSRTSQAAEIAGTIDGQIRANYRCWPSNYVARDLLEGGDAMRAHYTDEKRDEFIARLATQLDSLRLTGDTRESVRRLMLESYMRPTIRAAS